MSICEYCYENTEVKSFRGEDICRECRIEILMKEDSTPTPTYCPEIDDDSFDSYVMTDNEVISHYSPEERYYE